MTRLYITAAFH